MRRQGKTHAQILLIKNDLENGTPCWVHGLKEPTDYINRLKDLGVNVFVEKIDEYFKFVLDDSVI